MTVLNLPAGTQIITEEVVNNAIATQRSNSRTIICWFPYIFADTVTEIVIPESVTAIDDYTFYGCASLSSIVIPKSVTKIGQSPFIGCRSLTTIVLPDGITKIGDFTFCGCESLTTIVLHDGITQIGDYAFDECKSLSSIVIPGSVTEIGAWAFIRCSNLKTIYVSDMLADKGKDYWAQRGIDTDSVTLIRHSEIKTWVDQQGLFISYNNHNQAALYDWCQHHINPNQLPDIAFKIPYADILMLRSYHEDVLLKIPKPLERLDHNTCSRLSFFRRSNQDIPPKLLEFLTIKEIYNLFKAHVYDKVEDSPEKVEILQEISRCNV